MPPLSLTTTVATQRFSRAQEDRLVAALTDLDTHTLMWPIETVEDVLVAPTGQCGKQGYKLTPWALSRLCSLACPSLYGFALDLSGARRTLDEAAADFSVADAAATINLVLRRRFESRLYGRVFLVNTLTGTIDGVVTQQYRYLSNLNVYERVRAVMTANQRKTEFFEAALEGRSLLLRYFHPTVHCSLSGNIQDRFFGGYSFSNDEAGQASVRGGVILVRESGKTTALLPTHTKHVIHTGTRFEARLTDLLTRTVRGMKSGAQYAAALEQLRASSLDISGEDEKAEQKARRKLLRRLVTGAGDSIRPIAMRAIVSAVRQASYESEPLPLSLRTRERSWFDVYNALGRVSRTLAVRPREAGERLAGTLLAGIPS
jgi:hypothetical protein